MKKLILINLFLGISFTLTYSQIGYILTEDSVKKVGLLKYRTNFNTGVSELELWKTYNDKNPQGFPINSLKEYAIEKDTFKIFKFFLPYERKGLVVDLVISKVISGGKVNLYSTFDIESEHSLAVSLGTYGAQYYKQSIESYILDDNKGYILAIDKEYFKDDLSRFIGDNNQLMNELVLMKKFSYKKIAKLIKRYNQGLQ
jgi:hypothetical protein